MNSGLVHSELNYNFRLFAKTISSSAAWGFDRFRLFNSKWHTKIQVRRLDGSVVATQSFAPDGAFEHTFSFDLSGNVTNEEYSVYIAGVAVGQNFNQAYAWPTGYSATTGKNAELTYWDFREVNVIFSGTSGRIRFENNPITNIDGALLLEAAEVNFANCSLGAEVLADMLIGLDNSGISNGSFNYSGNAATPAERGLAAYNSLKDTKAWVLTGLVPAAAAALYDTDYQEVLDVATANGIAWPDQTQIDIDNQLMIDIKASGYYTKRAAIAKVKGTASIPFKLICWKRKILMNAYGSLTWDVDGVSPNGANGYIDPLWDALNSPNYGISDAGYDFVAIGTPVGGSGANSGAFGYYDGGITTYINILNGGTSSQASLHALVKPPEWMVSGYNAVNRDGDVVNVNNGFYTKGSAPATEKTRTPFLLARRRADNGTVDNYFKSKVSFMSIGQSVLTDYTTIKPILE